MKGNGSHKRWDVHEIAALKSAIKSSTAGTVDDTIKAIRMTLPTRTDEAVRSRLEKLLKTNAFPKTGRAREVYLAFLRGRDKKKARKAVVEAAQVTAPKKKVKKKPKKFKKNCVMRRPTEKLVKGYPPVNGVSNFHGRLDAYEQLIDAYAALDIVSEPAAEELRAALRLLAGLGSIRI